MESKMGDYALCKCLEPIIKIDWKGFKRCGWCMKPIINPTPATHRAMTVEEKLTNNMGLYDKIAAFGWLLLCLGGAIVLTSYYWIFDVNNLPIFPKVMLLSFGLFGILICLLGIYGAILIIKN